jgi:hypothetical protein
MNYTLIEDKDGFFNEGWGQGNESQKTFSGFLNTISIF